MRAMAPQITGALIVYWTVSSDADQRKHQSSASLVCVRGIPRSHRWIPHTKASDAEHVSIWWRHHENRKYRCMRITRKLGSTATSTVITRLLPLTDYISGTENETQRALLGHTNGNIEMRSPSVAAMLTMFAAATIVRFPPVSRLRVSKQMIFENVTDPQLITIRRYVIQWFDKRNYPSIVILHEMQILYSIIHHIQFCGQYCV